MSEPIAMDAFAPAEMAERVENVGIKKGASQRITLVFVSPIFPSLFTIPRVTRYPYSKFLIRIGVKNQHEPQTIAVDMGTDVAMKNWYGLH